MRSIMGRVEEGAAALVSLARVGATERPPDLPSGDLRPHSCCVRGKKPRHLVREMRACVQSPLSADTLALGSLLQSQSDRLQVRLRGRPSRRIGATLKPGRAKGSCAHASELCGRAKGG